ncbi:hypothetical protein PsorP6_011465 [Peronosclerospora sorghi]|uniref:Uncharacterized protein n=1 Tax=Peronosclerospora sorghi TaxID=230839 RepID=A0ACC0WJJ3_9STRA|nr:hypothetical protein PsorP6_011465 [Peronosclerospora sorghi]
MLAKDLGEVEAAGEEGGEETDDAEITTRLPTQPSAGDAQYLTSTIVELVRALASSFKKSPQQLERFSDLIAVLQPNMVAKGVKDIKRDVATRWNSTYYMLESALQMRSTIEFYCRDEDKIKFACRHQWR